jgi:hypothetical protein
MLGNTSVAAQLEVSKDGLSSMELVSYKINTVSGYEYHVPPKMFHHLPQSEQVIRVIATFRLNKNIMTAAYSL